MSKQSAPLRKLGFLTIGLFDEADPRPGHEATLQLTELGEQLGFDSTSRAMLPLTRAVAGSRPRAAIAVTLLPDPDSPTSGEDLPAVQREDPVDDRRRGRTVVPRGRSSPSGSSACPAWAPCCWTRSATSTLR
ncbi:hypothetical protein [Micromonospora sp. DH14]|uniref:hypothetical protein n=1 Tax=Micromonospora sp. DH14 TaxID=3040120 RepID=UPI002440F4F8|nr:hypothetical protein [Micromonospora sp. DH14]MDG9675873.1 hypothetical protein [Micromonospora sp. DH14]